MIVNAKKGVVEIFTLALTLIEVNKGSQRGVGPAANKIKDLFENDYIVIISLHLEVGELGRELMQMSYSKLKPPDASPKPNSVATSDSPQSPSCSRLTACALNSPVKLRRVRFSAMVPSSVFRFLTEPSTPRGKPRCACPWEVCWLLMAAVRRGSLAAEAGAGVLTR